MSIKEKILTGLLGLVLTILIVKEISRPVSKPVETNEITKEILKKLDSIKVKDTMIYVKEQENKKLLKELVGIKLQLKQLDEKLKKDTSNINGFNVNQLDSFFRARYRY